MEKYENNADRADTWWKTVTKQNITTIYGKSEASRIYDPENNRKIFRWLIEKSHDAKGNIIEYSYKRENDEEINFNKLSETHRKDKPFAALYPKEIKYGNKTINPETEKDYSFKLIFDYGEHTDTANPASPVSNWDLRKDPFSDYRSGFEIRQYRLCRKVLMFHNFTELEKDNEDNPVPVLVKTTDLTYDKTAVRSLLTKAKHTGYKKENSTYTSKSLPAMEFEYTDSKPDPVLKTLPEQSLKNLPIGISGKYQWTDLYNNGLSGILYETNGTWYYKENLGNGIFTKAQELTEKPSPGYLSGSSRIMDINSDGENELVLTGGILKGYYEKRDGKWQSFVPFKNMPNINFNDPYLKYIDLTGDGLADILISGNNLFYWYESKGKDGYAPLKKIAKAVDEKKGAAITFADKTETIFLADMTGDGLTDIVRIKNRETAYWPNKGYGRFGRKVTMDNSPVFTSFDLFNPKYIKLGDVDGSGTTDIIYLGNGVKYYKNCSGNSFSAGEKITNFPAIDNHSNISLVDLLGTGTQCLVWSSDILGATQMRYTDLMSSKKPYLLTKTDNNMGKITTFKYKPSTQFYLEDRKAGYNWLGNLHFAVHTLSEVKTEDLISKTSITASYDYHHGYYDRKEREFRGFGFVKQKDMEAFVNPDNTAEELNQPAVITKTWYHTGSNLHINNSKITNQYESEYYESTLSEEDRNSLRLFKLEDTILNGNFSDKDEALRILKGRPLRQEIYAENRRKCRQTIHNNRNKLQNKRDTAKT